jgi:Protein of unknown function (DUF992)
MDAPLPINSERGPGWQPGAILLVYPLCYLGKSQRCCWSNAGHQERPGAHFMQYPIILGAVTGSMLAAGAFAQVPAEHVQAGTLTCDISGGIGFIIGSQKALNCSFVPMLPGPPEFYSGVINKLGVDLGGTRGGVMIWAVYAPTTRAAGFLAGTYLGASAEVTVGAGIGANVLVGGSSRTVELQPISVQQQTGINVAAGVAEIELHFVR